MKFTKKFVENLREKYDVEILDAETVVAMDDYTEILIQLYFDIISVMDSQGNIDVLLETEDEVLEYLEA